jgi:hypothetical protein
MADVTKNLGQASKQDVHAIAAYINSLSARHRTGRGDGDLQRRLHDRNNVGPSKALPLSLSTAVHQAESANTVRVGATSRCRAPRVSSRSSSRLPEDVAPTRLLQFHHADHA